MHFCLLMMAFTHCYKICLIFQKTILHYSLLNKLLEIIVCSPQKNLRRKFICLNESTIITVITAILLSKAWRVERVKFIKPDLGD